MIEILNYDDARENMYVKRFHTVPDHKGGRQQVVSSFLSHRLPVPISSPACPAPFPISWIFFFYFAKLGFLIWIRISTRWCSLWQGSGKCSQRESSAQSRCVFSKAMSVRAHVLFVVPLALPAQPTHFRAPWNPQSNLFLGTASYFPYTKA